MRKGDDVPGLSGVKYAGFINYWVSAGQVVALAKLSGMGVSAANDQALVLYLGTPFVNGTIQVLMREGDLAPGCAPATIGVISRVEVESLSCKYLVLATLAGAPVTSKSMSVPGQGDCSHQQQCRRPVPAPPAGNFAQGGTVHQPRGRLEIHLPAGQQYHRVGSRCDGAWNRHAITVLPYWQP